MATCVYYDIIIIGIWLPSKLCGNNIRLRQGRLNWPLFQVPNLYQKVENRYHLCTIRCKNAEFWILYVIYILSGTLGGLPVQNRSQSMDVCIVYNMCGVLVYYCVSSHQTHLSFYSDRTSSTTNVRTDDVLLRRDANSLVAGYNKQQTETTKSEAKFARKTTMISKTITQQREEAQTGKEKTKCQTKEDSGGNNYKPRRTRKKGWKKEKKKHIFTLTLASAIPFSYRALYDKAFRKALYDRKVWCEKITVADIYHGSQFYVGICRALRTSLSLVDVVVSVTQPTPLYLW